MAVIDVYKEWSTQQVTRQQQEGVDNWEGRAVESYTVLVSSPTDAASTVLAHADVPNLGAAHGDYADLKVVLQVPAKRGPTLWGVEVQYAGANDPLNEPYDRRWASANQVEQVNEDASGDLIANSVGDAFAGVEKDVADIVWTVTRNEATFPVATARSYVNTVSNGEVQGFDAGEAYMRSIGGVYVPLGGGNFYYRVTYEVVFRVGGWGVRLANKGPRYRPAAGVAPVAVRDRLNVEEARLAANGTLLADGADDVWLTFDLYPATDFSTLALG